MSRKVLQFDENKPKGPKKAIILARVSTKEQEEGYSIAAQKHRLQQYCERKRLEVVQTFEVIESSTHGDRKDFMGMIEFIRKQRECVALVADKVDRVQRSFKEYPLLDALIQEGKLELHFNTENYIIHRESVSQERLMWSIGVVMAQSYVDSLRDNVKRSIDQKLRVGECIGTAPIGYMNIRDQRGRSQVVIDPDRMMLVRRIFQEYSTGQYTLGEITQKAKEWDLRNYRGYQKHLDKSQIHRMIQNPFYYGEMHVKGRNYPHVYEPLITKELYDACQAVRLGWHKKPFAYGEKDHIFRGLITCAVTGKIVTTDTKLKKYQNGRVAEYRYLMTWNPENPAKKLWLREEQVMAEVELVFKNMAPDADLFGDVVEYTRQTCETEKVFQKRQIEELNSEYKAIQAKLDKLMDLLLDDAISRTEHDGKRDRLKQRQIELSGQMNAMTYADDSFRDAVVDTLELGRKAHELFVSSNNEGKRRLINFVFSNLQLNGQKLQFSLRKPFDLYIKASNCGEWRGRRDSNPRHQPWQRDFYLYATVCFDAQRCTTI